VFEILHRKAEIEKQDYRKEEVRNQVIDSTYKSVMRGISMS